MTRWILAAVAATLMACGGAEEAQSEPVPAADAGADVAPDALPEAFRCDTGLTLCAEPAGRTCVYVQDDAAHCGSCGNACAAGAACVAGRCQM